MAATLPIDFEGILCSDVPCALANSGHVDDMPGFSPYHISIFINKIINRALRKQMPPPNIRVITLYPELPLVYGLEKALVVVA
jgi:hypothetical protein